MFQKPAYLKDTADGADSDDDAPPPPPPMPVFNVSPVTPTGVSVSVNADDEDFDLPPRPAGFSSSNVAASLTNAPATAPAPAPAPVLSLAPIPEPSAVPTSPSPGPPPALPSRGSLKKFSTLPAPVVNTAQRANTVSRASFEKRKSLIAAVPGPAPPPPPPPVPRGLPTTPEENNNNTAVATTTTTTPAPASPNAAPPLPARTSLKGLSGSFAPRPVPPAPTSKSSIDRTSGEVAPTLPSSPPVVSPSNVVQSVASRESTVEAPPLPPKRESFIVGMKVTPVIPTPNRANPPPPPSAARPSFMTAALAKPTSPNAPVRPLPAPPSIAEENDNNTTETVQPVAEPAKPTPSPPIPAPIPAPVPVAVSSPPVAKAAPPLPPPPVPTPAKAGSIISTTTAPKRQSIFGGSKANTVRRPSVSSDGMEVNPLLQAMLDRERTTFSPTGATPAPASVPTTQSPPPALPPKKHSIISSANKIALPPRTNGSTLLRNAAIHEEETESVVAAPVVQAVAARVLPPPPPSAVSPSATQPPPVPNAAVALATNNFDLTKSSVPPVPSTNAFSSPPPLPAAGRMAPPPRPASIIQTTSKPEASPPVLPIGGGRALPAPRAGAAAAVAAALANGPPMGAAPGTLPKPPPARGQATPAPVEAPPTPGRLVLNRAPIVSNDVDSSSAANPVGSPPRGMGGLVSARLAQANFNPLLMAPPSALGGGSIIRPMSGVGNFSKPVAFGSAGGIAPGQNYKGHVAPLNPEDILLRVFLPAGEGHITVNASTIKDISFLKKKISGKLERGGRFASGSKLTEDKLKSGEFVISGSSVKLDDQLSMAAALEKMQPFVPAAGATRGPRTVVLELQCSGLAKPVVTVDVPTPAMNSMSPPATMSGRVPPVLPMASPGSSFSGSPNASPSVSMSGSSEDMSRGSGILTHATTGRAKVNRGHRAKGSSKGSAIATGLSNKFTMHPTKNPMPESVEEVPE